MLSFAQYCALNRQITRLKSGLKAIFVENGVGLKREGKARLFAPESGLELVKELEVSAASRVCLEVSVQAAKERVAAGILLAGEPLKS
jgi:hypothetical protein